MLCSFCAEHMPQWRITRLEGTYLVWVDITADGMTSDELTAELTDKARVMVNSGTMYGREAGEGFIRINIACQRARLGEALRRIAAYYAARR